MPAPEIHVAMRNGQYFFYCPTHMYFPSAETSPVPACADCWKASYLMTMARQKSAEDKQEFSEGLEMLVKHIIEHEKDGTWDYVPNLEMSINKEN